MEYDLKQAKSMQSGMIFNMMFMWFLHFKMGQVQPLLIQAITGFINLFYSPLFQVYVLGRNLERPFVNPAAKRVQDATVTETSEPEVEEVTTKVIEAAEEEASDADDEDDESEDESLVVSEQPQDDGSKTESTPAADKEESSRNSDSDSLVENDDEETEEA
jgi:hypothetical protein